MKTLSLFIALLLTSVANAQTLAGTFAPGKNGVGVMLEPVKIGEVRLVLSYDFGVYKQQETDVEKMGFGVHYDWFLFLYQYTQLHTAEESKNLQYYKHSFEVGGDVELTTNVRTGMLYDPLNRECRLMVAFILK